MYGQGNYAPQFGRGSHTPNPPFQQQPMAPPSPPLQQGLSASRPSLTQQVPPPIPHHVGYSASFAYQHAPAPPVQQGPPVRVPASGMLNAGLTYLPQPPQLPQQVRGSAYMAQPYPTAQQMSQSTQNMHHIPTPVPPPLGPPPAGPSGPEMFRSSIPPGVLSTLSSQGQTLYRGPYHLTQPGSQQGTQQIPQLPPPPPPPLPPRTSSLFTPAPFGSFVHSAHQDSNVPVMGPIPPLPPPPPPPPPSSPPPLPPPPPPPPPPPTSPLPFGTLSSTPLPTAFDSVDKVVVVTTQITEEAPESDDHKNPEGKAGSPVEEDLSDVEVTELDLPPPPPKPAEEKVLQKIEVLCHFIGKNGHGFEDMARQKECGNPEFSFLFGGEPGSEAAVAHDYFEWMKKKCILACKLQQQEHSNSALRPSDIDISMQINSLVDAGASDLPSDSDMDMEDDITQHDEEQQIYISFGGLNSEEVLIPKGLDIQEQLRAPQNDAEQSLASNAISGSSGLAKQEKGSKLFPDDDHSTYETSLPKVDISDRSSSGVAKCPSINNLEKFSIPQLEDSSQFDVSATAAGTGFDAFPGELIKGASPFRLLQDYASDESSEDDDKPCLEDVSPVTASPSTTAGGTSLHGGTGSNLQIDPGPESLTSSDMAFGTSSEFVVACSLSMPSNSLEFFSESQHISREANITSTATVKIEEFIENNNENQPPIDDAIFPEPLLQKDALDGFHEADPESGKSQGQKEDVKYTSTLPKVDEFGRLVREGANGSDSDDSRYDGRLGKRGRSWSRSRSPHDSRRRSPRRRKERRSRSRSWSPKKRRSRSRSPSYRRGGELSGDKMRRDKGQLPECFDFLKGRCHRGAFCRYMHHDSNKSDGARSYRRKQQYVDVPPVSRISDFREEIEKDPLRRSVHDLDMPGSSFGATEDGNKDREKVLGPVQDTVENTSSGREDESLLTDVAKSVKSRVVTATVQETRDIKEEIVEAPIELPDNENCLERVETGQPVDGSSSCQLTDAGASKSPGGSPHGISSPHENLVIPQSQASNPSLPVLQKAFRLPQDADGSSTSGSSLFQSTTSQNQLPVSASHVNKISPNQSFPGTGSISQPFSCDSFSSQTLPPKELIPPVIPVSFSDHHSQIPPPLPSLSQDRSTPPPLLPKEIMQPTSNFLPFYPPNQPPLQIQHSHFSVPPNSSWSLPPPPPLPPRPPFVNNSNVTAATAMQGAPWLQFQQNPLPPRNDFSTQTFVRPYPPQLPAHSQVGESQHRSYSLMEQEPPQFSSQMEDFRPKPQPVGNPMSQPFGVTGLVGERFSRFPVQGSNPLFGQGNSTLQPVPSMMDSGAKRIHSFLGDNLPSDEFSMSIQNYAYSQEKRPLYGLQKPEADDAGVNLGDYGNINSTISRFTSVLIDRNQPSDLPDFGRSRISNHYNPYASTFDQPLASKISQFSSNVFKQEKDVATSNLFDAPHSLSHLPLDGQGVGSLGSRHMTSSPKSVRAADLLRLDGDQYDPLFDSIEPSSNSLKLNHDQRHEPTLRLSSSSKPLNVGENKQKEVESVAITTSIKSENDEYGETADAEVGDVDNVSASNPLDEANTGAGEIEIDQIKTPGKSKKSKDSRSMKLFKVAIADFVKEVLKPSWRQGNMSKEAFKTIVKKTVDKVSGAMKSHHIPKSQARINQYIDSSQRKLTKLVMGYVQKYAKV